MFPHQCRLAGPVEWLPEFAFHGAARPSAVAWPKRGMARPWCRRPEREPAKKRTLERARPRSPRRSAVSTTTPRHPLRRRRARASGPRSSTGRRDRTGRGRSLVGRRGGGTPRSSAHRPRKQERGSQLLGVPCTSHAAFAVGPHRLRMLMALPWRPQLPLPLAPYRCGAHGHGCGAHVDASGAIAAFPRTGLLARRAKPFTHAWVRIARQVVGCGGQVYFF